MTRPTFLLRLLFFGSGQAWDISPDGQRFLMIKPTEGSEDDQGLTVVLNWTQELLERVPVP